MTPGTGKRSYLACRRCRSRKTRCDLWDFPSLCGCWTGLTSTRDSIGEPKNPPCVSCHHSGSQCVLAESRRGGNFRPYRTRKTPVSRAVAGRPAEVQGPNDRLTDGNPSTPGLNINASDEGPCVELRNPSDALQILAQSDQADQDVSSPYHASNDTDAQPQTSSPESLSKFPSSSGQPQATVLDNYALVERGLVHPSILPELLYTWVCLAGHGSGRLTVI